MNPPRPHDADSPEGSAFPFLREGSPCCVEIHTRRPRPFDTALIGRPDAKKRFREPLENASHLPAGVRPLRTCIPAAPESPRPHTCNLAGCMLLRKLDRLSFPARHRCGLASLCRLQKSGM